jgi:hypothetical protein
MGDIGRGRPARRRDCTRYSKAKDHRAPRIAELKRYRLLANGVNDDSMPIVLDLVDQLHGLRYLLRGLLLTFKAPRREQDRP